MGQWFILWRDDKQENMHKKGIPSWEAGTMYIDNRLRHAYWTALVRGQGSRRQERQIHSEQIAA